MPGPLVNVSVIHSYDPGHKLVALEEDDVKSGFIFCRLRLEHTHCYSSQNQGDGGHYHYDVSPETVSYEGWYVDLLLDFRHNIVHFRFAPAQKIYRIDEI